MASSGYQYSSPPVELDIDGLYKFKLAPVEMQAWPFNELTDKETVKSSKKQTIESIVEEGLDNNEDDDDG